MKILFKKIKINAKQALQTNWSKAIAIMFIIALIWALVVLTETIISSITGVSGYIDSLNTISNFFDDTATISPIAIIISSLFTVITFLVFHPLFMGFCRWNLNVISGEQNEVVDIFVCFRSIKVYLKAVALGLCLLWRYFLFAILFFILPVALNVVGLSLLQSMDTALYAIFSFALIIISSLIYIVSFILFLIFVQKYAFAKYIFITNTELPVSKIIKLSSQSANGARFRLAMFKLSFLWLYIVGIVLLLPLLYVIPYYNASNAIYAKLLLEKHKIKVQQEEIISAETVYYTQSDSADPQPEI